MKSLLHILEGIFDVDIEKTDAQLSEMIISELTGDPKFVASFKLNDGVVEIKFNGAVSRMYGLRPEIIKKYNIKKIICPHHILISREPDYKDSVILNDVEFEVKTFHIGYDVQFNNCTITADDIYVLCVHGAFKNCNLNCPGPKGEIFLSNLPDDVCPGSTVNAALVHIEVADTNIFGREPDNIKTFGLFMDGSYDVIRKLGGFSLNHSAKQFYEDNKHQLSRFNPTKEYGLGPNVNTVYLTIKRDPHAARVVFTKSHPIKNAFCSFKCSGGWTAYVVSIQW